MKTYSHPSVIHQVQLPGNTKMKKALTPPTTLITLLMSGMNTAMRRATVTQAVVKATRVRLS